MKQHSVYKIHIEFGIPEHGWLLTRFSCGDLKLEEEISDVPLDRWNSFAMH